MSQSVCPVCNLKVGDYETVCPGCKSAIKAKKDIDAEIHAVFSKSEYAKLVKSTKSNAEMLRDFTPEQKRAVAAYKDLKGKYPWEVDRENSNAVPTTKIILPEDHKKQTQTSATKKQTTSATAQTRHSGQTTSPYTVKMPSRKTTTTTTKTVPTTTTTTVKDKRSILLNLIVFCWPIVGLFYYFSAKRSKPKKAKSALRVALFSFALTFAITVLIEFGLVPEDIYTFIYNNSLNLFN